MKESKLKWAACFLAALFAGAPWAFAALTYVDITPPTRTLGSTLPGSYTDNGGGAFTLKSDGTGFYPNMDLTPTWDAGTTNWNFLDANGNPKTNGSGDVITFMYETVTGDFDRRVQITSIANETPDDAWTRGGIMARTGTNWYTASWQLIAANPAGANCVVLCGRASDGQHYTEWDRRQSGVTNALPNQWLRLRRVGDNFSAYVGTNGTAWTLVAQRYMVQPATMLVGPHAASGTQGSIATVKFANYGPTPLNDSIPPSLVSAGSIDKLEVGVKFSEPVSKATATVLANYTITQGGGGAVTITAAKLGIGGDAVYLTVTGLTNDNFTVTVLGGVQDTAGNTIAANSAVAAKALNWAHTDIGYFKDITKRPQPGDDPYNIGQSVAVSSDENPEIEIIGGGSNAWRPGDYIHYVYVPEKMTGDFDVTAAVMRYDHNAFNGGGGTGGWASSGLMLRDNLYVPGLNPPGNAYTNALATKVGHIAFEADIQADAPNWVAQTYSRDGDSGADGSLYGQFGTISVNSLIGGIKGYYSGLRATDASGNVDPQSSPNSGRYLRITRTGITYNYFVSYDRSVWAQMAGPVTFANVPQELFYGVEVMNDTGAGVPPYSAYYDNSHMMTPNDPLAPWNAGYTTADGTPALPPSYAFSKDTQYSVMRIRMFPHGVTDPLPTTLTKLDIRPADGASLALSGSWNPPNPFPPGASFGMTGGGTSGNAAWQNLPSPYDGTTGGDELTFAYEKITGDFDKQIQITSLTNTVYQADGVTPWDPASGDPPVDTWARAGLMVRTGTNAYSACLAILAGNPVGANVVRVIGHALDGQKYTQFSRDYPGVTNVIPNQYLRMKRVGNNFSFYVSKDGVVWSTIAQQYMELPSQVLFGPYTAASLSPTDSVNNPFGALSKAVVSFSSYKDVNTGDVVPPVLMSVGTIDKKTIGVKFSKQVSSATGTVLNNYTLSQGTVTAAKMGIGGDAVYLTVSGLTSNTFTVTVTNVTDTFGNKLAGSQSASGKVTAWTATDIGYIQNPANRPTPGDDPYRVGQTVATSSEDEDTSELEVVGGGSNEWLGGFDHYVYKASALTGDFDVACKITRYDKENTAGAGGSDNSGLMLRQAVYNAGEENTVAGTEVPFISYMTYHEGSAGPTTLWRDTVHATDGANGSLPWNTVIAGLKGYFPDTRATNAAGQIDSASSPYQAQWLRIKRTGSTYNFYASWDGINWQLSADSPMTGRGVGSDPLLLGYFQMNDSGDANAPFSAYIGNGHTLSPTDPLGATSGGHAYQNESNFTVTKVRIYNQTSSIGAIKISQAGGKPVINYSGTLVSSPSLTGPWTVVPQQSSPHSVTPTGSSMFFRVLP